MITSFCLRYKQNTWHNRFLVCTGTFFLQTWVSKTAAADRGSSSRQLEHWGLITSDQWLLNTLSRGYYLQFQYQPPPKTEVWDLNQFILLVEVQSPLEKQAIKITHAPESLLVCFCTYQMSKYHWSEGWLLKELLSLWAHTAIEAATTLLHKVRCQYNCTPDTDTLQSIKVHCSINYCITAN